jgi:arginyl-tRNA--protein transferase 1
MWAQNLSADMYQKLINRGWRRSGKYCYKVLLNKSCCSTYTIRFELDLNVIGTNKLTLFWFFFFSRCEAFNYSPSKSQRKVLRRFNEYLLNGTKPKWSEKLKKNEGSDSLEKVPSSLDNNKPLLVLNTDVDVDINSDSNLVKSNNSKISSTCKFNLLAADSNATKSVIKDKSRKAKNIRIKRKLNKLMCIHQINEEEAHKLLKEKRNEKLKKLNKVKVYEDYFNQPSNAAHKLQVNVCAI